MCVCDGCVVFFKCCCVFWNWSLCSIPLTCLLVYCCHHCVYPLTGFLFIFRICPLIFLISVHDSGMFIDNGIWSLKYNASKHPKKKNYFLYLSCAIEWNMAMLSVVRLVKWACLNQCFSNPAVTVHSHAAGVMQPLCCYVKWTAIATIVLWHGQTKLRLLDSNTAAPVKKKLVFAMTYLVVKQ